MIRGKIKGWNFKRGYNADGASTLETLTAEKKRLEARLVEIPKLIAQLQHSINVIQNDINWLGSLSSLKRKRWEKENGKTIGQAQHEGARAVTEMKGRITALSEEKARIPNQIKAIQKQLDALVKGEATGLEKGIDKETARELGELELQKERERMEHERLTREAELKAEQARLAEQKNASSGQKKWLIGIGVVVLLVTAYIVYKRKFAVKTTTA